MKSSKTFRSGLVLAHDVACSPSARAPSAEPRAQGPRSARKRAAALALRVGGDPLLCARASSGPLSDLQLPSKSFLIVVSSVSSSIISPYWQGLLARGPRSWPELALVDFHGFLSFHLETICSRKRQLRSFGRIQGLSFLQCYEFSSLIPMGTRGFLR